MVKKGIKTFLKTSGRRYLQMNIIKVARKTRNGSVNDAIGACPDEITSHSVKSVTLNCSPLYSEVGQRCGILLSLKMPLSSWYIWRKKYASLNNLHSLERIFRKTYKTVFGQFISFTGHKVANFIIHPMAMAGEMHWNTRKVKFFVIYILTRQTRNDLLGLEFSKSAEHSASSGCATNWMAVLLWHPIVTLVISPHFDVGDDWGVGTKYWPGNGHCTANGDAETRVVHSVWLFQ